MLLRRWGALGLRRRWRLLLAIDQLFSCARDERAATNYAATNAEKLQIVNRAGQIVSEVLRIDSPTFSSVCGCSREASRKTSGVASGCEYTLKLTRWRRGTRNMTSARRERLPRFSYRAHPHLYEINTWVWLEELSARHGRSL